MLEAFVILIIAVIFAIASIGAYCFRRYSPGLADEDVLPLTAINRSPPTPPPPPPSPPSPSPIERPAPALLSPVPSLTFTSSTSQHPRTPPTPADPPTPRTQDLPIPAAAAAAVIAARSRDGPPMFDTAPAQVQKSPSCRASRVAKRASGSLKKTRALKATQMQWDLYTISEIGICELSFPPPQLVQPKPGLEPPCPNEPGGFF